MTTLTANQTYHLILADIAMAAAIDTHDPDYIVVTGAEGYTPGCLRDGWLERVADDLLRRRVTAMASAALASLQSLNAERLAKMAENYGVPLAPELAGQIVEHFTNKRDAVLTYNR